MKLVTSLMAILVLGLATSVSAQTPAPITGYEVQVFIAATNTTVTHTLTAVVCNLVPIPPPATPPNNPTTVQFDDVANAAMACRASVGDFFTKLPPANGYNATATALSSVGPSGKSALSNPFNVTVVLVPPFAPTGVGVR